MKLEKQRRLKFRQLSVAHYNGGKIKQHNQLLLYYSLSSEQQLL